MIIGGTIIYYSVTIPGPHSPIGVIAGLVVSGIGATMVIIDFATDDTDETSTNKYNPAFYGNTDSLEAHEFEMRRQELACRRNGEEWDWKKEGWTRQEYNEYRKKVPEFTFDGVENWNDLDSKSKK